MSLGRVSLPIKTHQWALAHSGLRRTTPNLALAVSAPKAHMNIRGNQYRSSLLQGALEYEVNLSTLLNGGSSKDITRRSLSLARLRTKRSRLHESLLGY